MGIDQYIYIRKHISSIDWFKKDDGGAFEQNPEYEQVLAYVPEGTGTHSNFHNARLEVKGYDTKNDQNLDEFLRNSENVRQELGEDEIEFDIDLAKELMDCIKNLKLDVVHMSDETKRLYWFCDWVNKNLDDFTYTLVYRRRF